MFLLLSLLLPTSLAFCPDGCACDEDLLHVTCLRSKLEVTTMMMVVMTVMMMVMTVMMMVVRMKMKMVVVTCLESKLELKIFDDTNNHSDDADN